MRKLFKKSLACCLAAILCVTVFAGALSVNAEEAIPSCSTNAISVKPGEDTVISLTISNFLNVLGVRFRVTLPDAVESVNSVKLGDLDLQPMDDETGVGYYILNGNSITFLSLFGAEIGDFDSTEVFTMNISVKIKEDVEVGDYSYSTPIFEVTEDGETLSDYIVNYGAFEVVPAEEPHEHTWGELEYEVVDGNCITKRTCECGEEDIIATIANTAPVNPNPVLASGLAIRFRVPQANLNGYTSIFGSFTKDLYSGATLTGVSEAITIPAATQGSNYQFEYTGIASYEMASQIHIKIFGTDDNENVVLLASSDQSLADFFKGRLATGNYSAENMKLYADTLRYGAESQKTMGYNTNNLANANVSENYNEFVSALPTTFTNTQTPKTGFEITPTVVVGNSVLFRIRFDKSEVAAYDAGTLKMEVEYTNSYGKNEVKEVTSFTDASNGTRYQYEFSELPCAYINDYFTVRIYAGEGTDPIATLDYSFQSYANTRYTGAQANATLCQAIVAYSNAAHAVFVS